jgi:hypothetical protein
MWRPRDRERFIGGYDPEHEMPDPDRGAGDRWQSDAYRHASRDSRFAYRMNPDRFENRFEGRDPRDYDYRWSRDARDLDRDGWRGGMNEGNYGGGGYYGGGGGYGFSSDRGWDRGGYSGGYGRDYDRGGYDRGYDRSFDRGPHFDRDRIYGSDRGWDYGREHERDRWARDNDREGWDRDRWDRDRDRWRR